MSNPNEQVVIEHPEIGRAEHTVTRDAAEKVWGPLGFSIAGPAAAINSPVTQAEADKGDLVLIPSGPEGDAAIVAASAPEAETKPTKSATKKS